MPILKARHHYVNKGKNTPFIKEIIPIEDREVSLLLFNSFIDITEEKIAIDDSLEEHNPKADIERYIIND